jgi:hypothetical protein
MNLDSVFSPIAFHGVPILGDGGLLAAQLAPGYGRPARRHFDHLDAVLDGTHVEAQTAPNAILLADNRLRPLFG